MKVSSSSMVTTDDDGLPAVTLSGNVWPNPSVTVSSLVSVSWRPSNVKFLELSPGDKGKGVACQSAHLVVAGLGGERGYGDGYLQPAVGSRGQRDRDAAGGSLVDSVAYCLVADGQIRLAGPAVSHRSCPFPGSDMRPSRRRSPPVLVPRKPCPAGRR